jgi:hypothetical protein
VRGDGDVADVCRLTCLEMGVAVLDDAPDEGGAVLSVEGNKIRLQVMDES